MARTDPQINIRVPVELKKELELIAIENGRSLNAEVVLRLENSLTKQKLTKIHPPKIDLLEAHIKSVIDIMRESKDWDEFKQKIDQKHPKQ